MKNLILLMFMSLTTALLTGCGDDSRSTSTGNNLGFSTYSDAAECNDSTLNPLVTTEYGVVNIGIPGNEDCPYRKAITDTLFVEAYTTVTSSRNFRRGSFYGISYQLNFNYRGSSAYQLQCPPGFQRIGQQRNFNQQVFSVNAYYNFNVYGSNQFRNNNNYNNYNDYNGNGYGQRGSIYDELDLSRQWCEPIYGSRWYDAWVDAIDLGTYL